MALGGSRQHAAPRRAWPPAAAFAAIRYQCSAFAPSEPGNPAFDAKPERIEHPVNERPDRTFAFDEFGPLGIRPTAGSCWAGQSRPDRLPATYRRTHGITYFHGCYSVGDDKLWGINRRRKGIDHTWTALRSIRAARPDGAPIYEILDNSPPI